MRDWMLRLMAVLSAGVVLLAPALPAAADVARPTWYGGALKAFDRMGVSDTDLPWWMGDGTVQQIVTLDKSRTLKIDAKLDDRVNGVPSQKDYDKALADHAGKIAYKDTTVDMALWLDALGTTFSDGYASSNAGTLSYGQSGYIPTADEIQAESVKLAHTSSYLLAQAQEFDPDATSGVSPSCATAMGNVMNAVDIAWNDSADTPGTALAASVSRDPEFGDVITYDSKDFKKYDAMALLDRDGGTLYYDEIEHELKKKAKGSNIDVGKVKSKQVTGLQAAKNVFAGIVKKGTKLLKGAVTQLGADYATGLAQGAVRSLIDLTYGSEAWCDSYVWGIGQKNIAVGVLSVLGKQATKAFAGLDCDELEQRKQEMSNEEWAKAMKQLKGGAKQDDQLEQDKADGAYTVSWSPWYVATVPGYGAAYARVWVYSGTAGSFVDFSHSQIRTTFSPDVFASTGDWHTRLTADYFGPFADQNNDQKVNKGTAWRIVSKSNLSPYWNDRRTASDDQNHTYVVNDSMYDAVLNGNSYSDDPDMRYYGLLGLKGKDYDYQESVNLTLPQIVSGDSGFVFSNSFLYFGQAGQRPVAGNYAGADAGSLSALPRKGMYSWNVCGGDCPAAYQPTAQEQDVTIDVTSNIGDGDTYTVSAGGQNTANGTGWTPGHIQTKVNSDGTVGGSVSIDAKTGTGTVNLGTGSLNGIYANAAGKRLDLIDVKTGKSCFAEGYACADWVKETQELIPEHQLDVTTKATTKDYPLTYKCSYDVPGKITEVPIGECIAYAPQFKQEAQRSGQTTGQPDGSTSTSTGTKPDTDYTWDDCVKAGTSGNVAGWLYEPIVCAADILLVPRTKVLTTTRSKFARDTSDGILPQFRDLTTNWGGLFDIDLGDCHGYRFSFGWGDIKIFDNAEVLNACPGQPLDFLPKISCAVITLVLCIGGVLICRKAFMAIFDYHPGGSEGDA